VFGIWSEVIRTFGKNLIVAFLKQGIKNIYFVVPSVDIGPGRAIYNGLSSYILWQRKYAFYFTFDSILLPFKVRFCVVDMGTKNTRARVLEVFISWRCEYAFQASRPSLSSSLALAIRSVVCTSEYCHSYCHTCGINRAWLYSL
jgi:hypothetical protein